MCDICELYLVLANLSEAFLLLETWSKKEISLQMQVEG